MFLINSTRKMGDWSREARRKFKIGDIVRVTDPNKAIQHWEEAYKYIGQTGKVKRFSSSREYGYGAYWVLFSNDAELIFYDDELEKAIRSNAVRFDSNTTRSMDWSGLHVGNRVKVIRAIAGRPSTWVGGTWIGRIGSVVGVSTGWLPFRVEFPSKHGGYEWSWFAREELEKVAKSNPGEDEKPRRVVCSWCGKVMVDLPEEGRTSHSICDKCFKKAEAEDEIDGDDENKLKSNSTRSMGSWKPPEPPDIGDVANLGIYKNLYISPHGSFGMVGYSELAMHVGAAGKVIRQAALTFRKSEISDMTYVAYAYILWWDGEGKLWRVTDGTPGEVLSNELKSVIGYYDDRGWNDSIPTKIEQLGKGRR